MRAPIVDALDRADQLSQHRSAPDLGSSRRKAAEGRIGQELSQAIERASGLLATGLINDRVTQEFVAATIDAVIQAEQDNDQQARARASSAVELHLLCTIFSALCQMIDEVSAGTKWTVNRFIDSAIRLPRKPSSTSEAVIAGVKRTFADQLADQATSLFLTSSAVPDRGVLRLLAIMFCPNSSQHREVRALESELAQDLTVSSIDDAINTMIAG